MPSFEYRTIFSDIRGGMIRKVGIDKPEYLLELNQLGADGWELVGIEKLGDPTSGFAQLMSVFKREIIPPEVHWQKQFDQLDR